jgi:hypothetical protein
MTLEVKAIEAPVAEAKAEVKAVVETKAFAPSYNATYVRPFYL